MKLLILLATLGVAAEARLTAEDFPVADNAEGLQYFNQWKLKHGKTYGSIKEMSYRYLVFIDNMKKAARQNALRKHPDAAIFGPTQFSDLTAEEFKQRMLSSFRASGNEKVKIMNATIAAPPSFDWTDKGYVVTPVKDQAQAGTCWAFAGLANVESQRAILTGKQSPDLSPESFSDCDGYSNERYGVAACGPLGATMPAFYIWAIKQGGFMAEADYPYCVGLGKCRPCAPPGYNEKLCGNPWPITPCNQEDSCAAKYDPAKFVPGIKAKYFYNLKQDEKILADALFAVGPLVAGMDATDLQSYTGGILEPVQCNPRALNHAVLLVGYGASSGESFWKVKNSWGKTWGEDGYFRISRGTGACGINADVSTVVLE